MPFDEEKEEDLSISFSGLKGLFKGSHPEKESSKGTKDSSEGRKEAIHQQQASESQKEKSHPLKSSGASKLQKDSEDEDSLDLSKVTSFFKGLKGKIRQEESDGAGEDDSLSFRLPKLSSFAFSMNRRWVAVFLLLIPLIAGTYIRLLPASLPSMDAAAASVVYDSLRSQAADEIAKQYPNLPAQNRNALVETEMQRARKYQRSEINAEIRSAAGLFKSTLKDDSGTTYLLGSEPYYWLSHAENIVENNHPGDGFRAIGGKEIPYDTLANAPVGRDLPPDMLHAYIEAYLYRTARIFAPGMQLSTAAFFLPVILSWIITIVLFFFGRRIAGDIAGFFAALVFALHPAGVSISLAGAADAKVYAILFPLASVWLFFEAMLAKRRAAKGGLLLAAGILTGLFAKAWAGGWWFIYDVIIAGGMIYSIILIVAKRKEFSQFSFWKSGDLGNALICTSLFAIAGAIFTIIFSGPSAYQQAFSAPLKFMALDGIQPSSLWPDIFSSVPGLGPLSIKEIIDNVGVFSIIYLALALAGVILLLQNPGPLTRKKLMIFAANMAAFVILLLIKPGAPPVFFLLLGIPLLFYGIMMIGSGQLPKNALLGLILAFWLFAGMYAGTARKDYLPAMVAPFGILVGVVFSEFFSWAGKKMIHGLGISLAVGKPILIIFLVLLFVPWAQESYSAGFNEIPLASDARVSLLEEISRNSSKDAVIASWWDIGSQLRYFGKRGIVFDGASQNSPDGFWIGSMLLKSDEPYAVGVLRMLACGQNSAFEKLDSEVNNPAASISILQNIIRKSRSDAEAVLKEKGISGKTGAEVLAFTHCAPPEMYFITSEDMAGKAPAWSQMGNWDFEKAQIASALAQEEFREDMEKSVKYLNEKFNFTVPLAEEAYLKVISFRKESELREWIGPPLRYQAISECFRKESSKVFCSLNQDLRLEVDFRTLETKGISSGTGQVFPALMAVPEKDGSLKMRKYSPSFDTGMLLLPREGNIWYAVLSDPLLTDSMFSKLFYLEGLGLKHFRKFGEGQRMMGQRVFVWKVDWGGNASNDAPFISALEKIDAGDKAPAEEIVPGETALKGKQEPLGENKNMSEENISIEGV
ncbi:hypothetical protein HYU14_02805 [Candidatus Woesearchaeota archaeon]|nr:hypothetical protein [Candidatus Woesearchaeota archaeon]